MTEFDSLDGFSAATTRDRARYRPDSYGGRAMFVVCLGILLLACVCTMLLARMATDDVKDRDPAIQREKEELREAWAGYRKDERDRRSAAARRDEEKRILNHGR